MKSAPTPPPRIAIACGGTGGHLFPGVAIGEELQARGGEVLLLVSHRGIDQQASRCAYGMEVVPLPAVGLTRGRWREFLGGFWSSFWRARGLFSRRLPGAVLAMGGFTAAAPVLAAKASGVPVFVHEANAIPGRANRWLAPWVDHVFVGFPETAARLASASISVTGTPVRSGFESMDRVHSCRALGFDPDRPLVLVVGGSQGAAGINALMQAAVPRLARRVPAAQVLHLSGGSGAEDLRRAYQQWAIQAVVQPFLEEMDLALGAATIAVSRAGASSLAEFAAARLPSILMPYPAATDNHQYHNARAYERTGAARLIEQTRATPELLADGIAELIADPARRQAMRLALARWHSADAAKQISRRILEAAARDAAAPDPSRISNQLLWIS